MRAIKNERGITLVELMITIAITGIVLLGAAYSLFTAKQLAEEARQRVVALNTAKTVLETVKNTPITSLGAINLAPMIPAALPGATLTLSTNPSPIIATTTLATVTVTVGWNGPRNRALTLRISTMRSNR